jgi:chromosomal replication initiation ATPase DnaA
MQYSLGMSYQKIFNYQFLSKKDHENYFVNQTNQQAYDLTILEKFDQNIFLFGPDKSGKSYLANLWKDKNNAISYNNNLFDIIEAKKNVVIDDVLGTSSDENLFHLINHCKLNNLKIYFASSVNINTYNFKFIDLYSRLREFTYLQINEPDDEMCKMLMVKLFSDKQVIIKNQEIFDFIFKRLARTYLDIYNFVEKLDRFSLEKKRQLTIPLIKEII